VTDKTVTVPKTPLRDLCATYSSSWQDFDNQAKVFSEPTIEGALNLAKRISAQEGGIQAFVTGSLHLVGGALTLLRP
jgi:folylpolyglutamate synthase